MIKIGVSACFLYPDPHRPVFGPKTLSYLENEMGRYLARRGVFPVLIPDLPEELLNEALEEMDGFVLPGGSDIAPQSYGEQPIENNRWPGDLHRDQYELKILDFAVKKQKPVLGLCRGFQLINTYFGGTLYQDLATQLPGSLTHRDAQQYDRINHPIEILPGGMLIQSYAAGKSGRVNSVHHQGVKKLGKDLVVEAVSPDDRLIEAFSCQSKGRFVLAVQWHPEFSATLKEKILPPEPLYNYFLKEVQK